MNFLGFFDYRRMLMGARIGPAHVIAIGEHELFDGTSLGRVRTSVVVQVYDAHRDDLMRYWQIPVGMMTTNARTPIDEKAHALLIERCKQIIDSFSQDLSRRSFQPVEAFLSWPRDLVLIQGDPTRGMHIEANGCIHWPDHYDPRRLLPKT